MSGSVTHENQKECVVEVDSCLLEEGISIVDGVTKIQRLHPLDIVGFLN